MIKYIRKKLGGNIMRTIVFTDKNKLDILSLDSILGDEKGICLSVIASGICGTDLHIVEGQGNFGKNIILGHEFYGSIDKIEEGTRVKCLNGDVEVGDFVTVVPGVICNKCIYCNSLPLNENYCLNRSVFGLNVRDEKNDVVIGGNMEQIFVPENFYLYKVPRDWPLGLATLLEPVSVAVKTVKKALKSVENTKNRSLTAVVFGLGTLGFFIGISLRKCGVKVIGVDPEKSRRDRALRNGIQDVFSYEEMTEEFYKEYCLNKWNGIEADMVFEAVGKPEVFAYALHFARKGGVVMEVGNFLFAGNAEISPNLICNRELTIMGSVLADANSYYEAEEILEDFADRSSDVICNYKVDEYEQAFKSAFARTEGLKNNLIFQMGK